MLAQSMKGTLLTTHSLVLLLWSTSTGIAHAGTTAYVAGGLLSGSAETCLKDMKVAADKTGFSESQQILMDDNKKAGDFHANQKGSPLHFTARCNPVDGVWSIAVSGIDNQQTYEEFNKVFDAMP
jgi:hypothetical protein